LRAMRQALAVEELGVDAYHQHLFVPAPVEDPDAPALRQSDGRPPQEVVIELLVRRLLERVDLAAGRIDARHDGADRAVLAGRIHRLEDEQEGPGVRRVELALELRDAADQLRQLALAGGVVRRLLRRLRARVTKRELTLVRNQERAVDVHVLHAVSLPRWM